MEKFDVLVVGSGSGASIADAALGRGMRVALVEHGPLGGTCLNRGCIPSKMVIYPADVATLIRQAERVGVKARVEDADFQAIMERTRRSVAEDRRHIEEGIDKIPNLRLYRGTGEFTGERRMRVGGEEVEAESVFIAAGARPETPPVRGLDRIRHLTYINLWDLQRLPRSIIVAGGGFIACEMAHFFSAMGSEVTVVSRSPLLLRGAEPEVSETLTQSMRSRMSVQTGMEMTEVREEGGAKEVTARDAKGQTHTFLADELLVATGLRGNGDILHAERTGCKVNAKGYIEVNDTFETGKPRVWAFGDVTGRAMFKHTANQAADAVWHAFTHGHAHPFPWDRVPYAVFTWPEVASVGLTQEEAERQGKRVLVGVQSYADTAYGQAMGEEDGFAKLIVEEETMRILGCHILGPHAPILIQEVVNCMSCPDGTVYPLMDAMHIHPALTEVVQRAAYRLRPPHSHQH